MNDHRNFERGNGSKASRVKLLVMAVIFTFALGVFLTSHAQAADWEGWPKQSLAERLGTFTYVYGSAGFVSHDETEQGLEDYRVLTGRDDDGNNQYVNAEPDSDDMFVTGGFGVRLPHEFNFEFGLAALNGAYDQQGANGTSPKPDQPVFEMSVLKSFNLGGPPLLRYTARVGQAFIDDPNTDDSTFFGIGISHAPFRAEIRQYDFGNFESQVI